LPPRVTPPADAPARHRFPSLVDDPEVGALRAALKDMRLQLLDQRRELQRLKHGGPDVERVMESPAYASATPRVSVIVPMHNEATCVTAALDSCTTQTMSEFELVVVDDGSSDRSSDTVARWSHTHAGVPLLLLRHPVNRGLGHARNTAIEHARALATFVLDADNALFDVTLERLLDELEARPDAAFVYSMLAMEENGVPVGLRSCFPWDPRRLRIGNYIDAMALWRTAALRELGGYTTELRLHGWEDYDLFCSVAETGRYGVLVPEILGRYRVRGHSMLSLTDISTRAAVSLLIERHPTVMRGVDPPL
ncbi:MAG TPA: glycosyltransferase family A protein, partial [Solirubrobacteraceae bacterium]|nr:glycosyltransferase family A protein [Solirubrobacteraceae bacterium]